MVVEALPASFFIDIMSIAGLVLNWKHTVPELQPPGHLGENRNRTHRLALQSPQGVSSPSGSLTESPRHPPCHLSEQLQDGRHGHICIPSCRRVLLLGKMTEMLGLCEEVGLHAKPSYTVNNWGREELKLWAPPLLFPPSLLAQLDNSYIPGLS